MPNISYTIFTGATMLLNIEEAKETVLDFPQGTLKVF